MRLPQGGKRSQGHGRFVQRSPVRLVRRAMLGGSGDRGLRGGSGVAEVLACSAHRRMVGAEHGGAGGGHTGVIPTRLVAIAQLVRDGPQLESQRQHQRIGMRPAAFPGGERLLQHPPGRTRIVRFPVQPGEQMSRTEHIWMIFAEGRPSRIDRIDQQVTGGGEVSRTTQREGPLLSDGQGRGMGHDAHAAGYRHLDATRPHTPVEAPPPTSCRTAGQARIPMCMIHLRRVQ
ncbi:hypothetical protein Vlu01_45060 [Micromonospora lutea]|uniref:Uncharacterized protein n=1 Tax=Micromonospora lutea TaxID=419825 RepID=A0ABQ4J199_9ACTN|nr:hypothetical protein Vlu01_45060 [Micromonospora lutea]